MFEHEMLVLSIPGFSDPVSALTHLVGSVVFAVLGFFLVRKARQAEHPGWNGRMTALAVFVFAAVAQLAVSGAYHILQPGLAPRLVLQQLDHAAIFVLIAASFVPVHVILFKGWQRWLILLVMVSVAAIGITINFLYFCIYLFLFSVVIMVVVSLLTPKPDDEHIRGLTFATTVAEDRAASRAMSSLPFAVSGSVSMKRIRAGTR